MNFDIGNEGIYAQSFQYFFNWWFLSCFLPEKHTHTHKKSHSEIQYKLKICKTAKKLQLYANMRRDYF